MAEQLRTNRAKFEREKVSGAIERLTRLHEFDQKKVIVLLAYAGAKPLSQFDIPYKQETMHDIQEMRDILNALGIVHEEVLKENHSGQRLWFRIARDFETLEKFRTLEQRNYSHNTSEWHREYGKLVGFPVTAVEAYVNHQPLFREPPDEIMDLPVGKFLKRIDPFRLSEAHWKSEIKVVEQWMQALHETAPEYLQNLLSDAWEDLGGKPH